MREFRRTSRNTASLVLLGLVSTGLIAAAVPVALGVRSFGFDSQTGELPPAPYPQAQQLDAVDSPASAPASTTVLVTPTPTAMAPSVRTPAISRWRTTFDENFADSRGSWPSDPEGPAWLSGDGYHLSVRTPGQFVAITSPALGVPAGDVMITARFHKAGGPPGGGYGLIFRNQSLGQLDGRTQTGQYYVFEVGDTGLIGLWRRRDNDWVDLVPWSPSPAVRQGSAQNELSVFAIGAAFIFLVNGVNVESVSDRALTEGGVGLFVGGDSNQAVAEHLLVEEAEPTARPTSSHISPRLSPTGEARG